MAESPNIIGPVTGGRHGWPFGATVVDLDAARYREEEYFLGGHARRYRMLAGSAYPPDGVWPAEEAGTRPYMTRVLVRRPIDAARFNGTVLVSWNNVSSGYEALSELTPDVAEAGFAQLCVSAQRVSVHGFPFPDPRGLTAWDEERYGELSIESDDLSYDIFTQAALASEQLTGGFTGKRIAMGASQSAMRLATYINAVQPLSQAFDAFMLDVYSGTPTLVDSTDPDVPRRDYNGPMTDIIGGLAATFRLRDDLPIPIMVLNSESEATSYFDVRLPDSDRYRFWEVAGAAHASSDRWELAEARTARDFGENPSPFPPPENRNTVSLDPVRAAVLTHVHRWVHGGPPPPSQARIDIAGDPPAIRRDEHGNAIGGVRLPDLEVPLARHVGERAHPVDMFGSTTPFPAEKLRALYGDLDEYMARYDKAVLAAVDAGVVLAGDTERMRQRAESTFRAALASGA